MKSVWHSNKLVFLLKDHDWKLDKLFILEQMHCDYLMECYVGFCE